MKGFPFSMEIELPLPEEMGEIPNSPLSPFLVRPFPLSFED